MGVRHVTAGSPGEVLNSNCSMLQLCGLWVGADAVRGVFVWEWHQKSFFAKVDKECAVIGAGTKLTQSIDARPLFG